MSTRRWNDKRKFIFVLSLLLCCAFLATSGISYRVAKESLSHQVERSTLPLTSDNIYSEIQQDLLRPVFISSLMAQDTFVRDWALGEEQHSDKMVRYLSEIQEKYNTVTSFFVSEKTRNYYHSSGVLKKIVDVEPTDAWYFRVRSLPASEIYEVNIDSDTADSNKTTIFVNYKVFDFEGRFIGVTGVGLAVEKVKERIEAYQMKYGRQVYFTDRQGNITLHGSAIKGVSSIQTRPGMDMLAMRILTSPSGNFSFRHDGATTYLNSRFVPEFKWFLVVEQSNSKAEKLLLNNLWLNLALSLAVSVIILFIASVTLGKYQNKLERMASTDKLTGASNRQSFEEDFSDLLEESQYNNDSLSMILVDLDYFKRINDTYGHSVGDLVLKSIAKQIRGQISLQDVLCRWGGEEFLILLPKKDIVSAAEVAENLRLNILDWELSVNGHLIKVTVSCGVAQSRRDETPDSLIRRADIALYQAKDQGRDQVVLNQ